MGIFPNEASIVRLRGANMLSQNGEWSLNRRYMQLLGAADRPQYCPRVAGRCDSRSNSDLCSTRGVHFYQPVGRYCRRRHTKLVGGYSVQSPSACNLQTIHGRLASASRWCKVVQSAWRHYG